MSVSNVNFSVFCFASVFTFVTVYSSIVVNFTKLDLAMFLLATCKPRTGKPVASNYRLFVVRLDAPLLTCSFESSTLVPFY